MGRLVGFAILLAFLMLLLGGPGLAENSVRYTDAAGDNPAGRPDILSINVSNDDYGLVLFEVTIGGERLMSDGERVLLFIDQDLNPATGSTGVGGAELRIRAFGTAGLPELSLCHWNGSAWDECGPLASWEDTVTGPNTHVMRLAIRYEVNASFDFNFQLVTALFDETGTNLDLSPEGGGSNTWRYQVVIVPDFDGDSLRGPDDHCPRVNARGPLDRNEDGCPGPFQRIRAVLKTVGVATGSATTFRRFALAGVPAGASVLMTSGSRREQLIASADGVASSKRFRRRLATGTKITIRATKPRFVGYFARYRIATGAKLVGRTRCIPAYGKAQPVACSSSLLGQ